MESVDVAVVGAGLAGLTAAVDLVAQGHRDPPQVSDDEELWPFQGEYWRDELGSYQYQLGRRCKRPRAPLQTASQPAAASEKVAETPKH